MNSEKYKCFLCGKIGPTERHHCFGGPNRRLAEEDKLVVHLCHQCHNEPPMGVHFNKRVRGWLQAKAQKEYEEQKIKEGSTPEAARELFMKRYGRNYRDE